jgi:hypothetical protein
LLQTMRKRLAPMRSVCGRCPVIRQCKALIRATLGSPLLPSPGITLPVQECTESEIENRGFPFWRRTSTSHMSMRRQNGVGATAVGKPGPRFRS